MKQVVTIVLCQDVKTWPPALSQTAARTVNWSIKGENCLQNVVKSHWPVDSHQAGHPCVQGRAKEHLSSREEPGSLEVEQSLVSNLGTLSFP